jgi:hypothetical protein
MNLVLLPYMGAAKAGRELSRLGPVDVQGVQGPAGLAGRLQPTLDRGSADMRVTYRTARVLRAIGERPGGSNREVAEQAGIVDQGQISRLLRRLESLGLIANQGAGAGTGSTTRGTANAWVLTARGEHMRRSVQPQARPASRPARR